MIVKVAHNSRVNTVPPILPDDVLRGFRQHAHVNGLREEKKNWTVRKIVKFPRFYNDHYQPVDVFSIKKNCIALLPLGSLSSLI